MEITLTTTIDIPESVLEDVLTTAVESGIGYWAQGESPTRRADLRVSEITVWDAEDQGQRFTLDASKMTEGIAALHTAIMSGDVHPYSEIGGQFLRHLFAIDQDDEGLGYVDAVCADAIVQFACFGKLMYS